MMRFSYIFCLTILISSYSFSQEEPREIDTIFIDRYYIDGYKIKEKTVFPNFYFGWSYLKPIGKYSKTQVDMLTHGETHTNPGKNIGLGFELGYFYWLEGINFFSDKMKLGVKTIYLSPQFIFINNYKLEDFDFNNSFKIGPTLAYNPIGSLVVDGTFTIGPTLFYSGSWDHLSLIFNYGFEIGVRYKPIYLGVGATFGQYNLDRQELVEMVRFPTSRMNITFGFNF